MEIALKQQKIRDRVIYMFNVIPQKVDVGRHVVIIELREKDVNRLSLSVAEVEKDLSALVDRKVEVVLV